MSLADFASLSTAISGFAVTASLIYLAIQTQQNTRNTRAQIHQGAAARTSAILMGNMDGETIAAWIECNGGKATPEMIRQRRFRLNCAIAINAMEDHYLQHLARLLNDEQFARNNETFRGLLQEPGMRAFWNEQRPINMRAAPRFTAFVDSLCKGDVEAFKNAV
jgi:hypothetical protein